jgi:hypothetical protein
VKLVQEAMDDGASRSPTTAIGASPPPADFAAIFGGVSLAQRHGRAGWNASETIERPRRDLNPLRITENKGFSSPDVSQSGWIGHSLDTGVQRKISAGGTTRRLRFWIAKSAAPAGAGTGLICMGQGRATRQATVLLELVGEAD